MSDIEPICTGKCYVNFNLWVVFAHKYVGIHRINKIVGFLIFPLTYRAEEGATKYIFHGNQRRFRVLIEHSPAA